MPSVHQKPCGWALARIKLALLALLGTGSGVAYLIVAAARNFGKH